MPSPTECKVWMNFGANGINSETDLQNNGWTVFADNYNHASYGTADNLLQFFYSGGGGYIEQTLPSGYSWVNVTWGASHTASYVEVFVGGTSEGTVTNPGSFTGISLTSTAVPYSSGDKIKVQEILSGSYGGVALIASIEVCQFTPTLLPTATPTLAP